jgi:methionyl-tRNA formyltransferase
MKIVFFGTPQFAVPCLQSLLTHPDFEVLAVVTQPDKRRGRGNSVTPSAVKAAAQAHMAQVESNPLPIWQPARIKKDADTLAKLDALGADAFVVIAYGQLLSQEMLDMPRLGCVNAHGSILPAYRGAAPIQWSLCKGEYETGVTTMLMDAGMDTGPMLMQETLPIGLLDNAWQMADKLSELGASLVLTTLQKLQQQMIRPVLQDDERATYAPLLARENYLLDWQNGAKALHDQVRGFYPNCLGHFREASLKIMATVPLGEVYWNRLPAELSSLPTLYGASLSQMAEGDTPAPGTIVALLKNYGPVIQTGNGHLLLLSVQPAGKKVLSGWDFVNGSRLTVGERLLPGV